MEVDSGLNWIQLVLLVKVYSNRQSHVRFSNTISKVTKIVQNHKKSPKNTQRRITYQEIKLLEWIRTSIQVIELKFHMLLKCFNHFASVGSALQILAPINCITFAIYIYCGSVIKIIIDSLSCASVIISYVVN